MARRMDILRALFEASSVCLCMVRHSEKRTQHSCLDCRGGRTWQATRVIAYTDPRLYRTGLCLRKGLTRNQSGQRSKPACGVVLSF
jgi:hypothetical protein